MVSNQVLQSTIEGIKSISGYELGLAAPGEDGTLFTAPVFRDAWAYLDTFRAVRQTEAQKDGFLLFKIYAGSSMEYILALKGTGEKATMVGRMAAFQIQTLMGSGRDSYDRDSFMKNLLLDNLLLVDIYERAKKLHIRTAQPRVVLVVEASHRNYPEQGNDPLTLLQNYPGIRPTDAVTVVDEDSIVICLDLESDTKPDAIAAEAADIYQYLASNGVPKARIASGSVVGELKELSRSYKEARMALDVSKIFFEDQRTIAYNQLGIGRLIYQLPIPLCRIFIREVFQDHGPEELDEETLTTIDKFFENNLNVSETARQLFIHRNTLVYRLDKLQKSTGLDIRNFDDAITFRIALMVTRYMKYMDAKNR